MAKMQAVFRAGRFVIKNYSLMACIRLSSQWRKAIAGRVTIITPTHNRLPFLQEAVESVRAQTYEDWEHVIVADGHDPRVEDYVDSLQDQRVSYHHTRPMRVMGNYQRNYALRFSSGEYILYLDDDNIIYPQCLSVMVAGFADKATGYVIAPIRYGTNIMSPKPPLRHGKIDLLNYMIRRRFVERVWGQNRHTGADFHLIDKVSRISSGNFIQAVIGYHR